MSQDIKIFTYDELKHSTNNYNTPIGEGGYGEVFKGVLTGDDDLVAVKRYFRGDLRTEFMEEVKIHSQMEHKNVVKLIGYCISEKNLMLVTEYISKGNLDDILHNSDTPISLDTRLGIAIGCADALSNMHSKHLSNDNLIYHGDIKPANILLDENFTAKVSDFGLSRLLSGGITQYTSKVVGSINYMDPACLQTGCLTPASDVYSFGIVLLELIARKRVKEGNVYLVGTFASAKGKGVLRELFDPAIAEKNNIEILQEMVKLANECLGLEISKRPRMNDVARRLRVLISCVKSRDESSSFDSILASHYCSWTKIDKKDKVQLKKSPSFLKRNASNPMILSDLGDVRKFTKKELKEITKNFSYQLGSVSTQARFYKGTLEDNTAVVVSKFLYHADSEEKIINGVITLSQIAHHNIIKLLGCCLEAETLVLIYEYASKGSLLDNLGSQEDFPLDKRLRIAIKTAEALEYLHSSATGIIGHGRVAASTIFLDNNFSPKLTDFSKACKLIKETEISDSLVTRDLLEKVLYKDPSRYMSVLMNLENDVYMFGCVLFAIISREKNISLYDLVVKFTKAYQTNDSGKPFFDKDITTQEDITVLEDIGRLALKCMITNVDDMVMRPTMKEVAEQLRMIRKSWKEHTTMVASTKVTEMEVITAILAEKKLPNLMRHLYGYRQIQ
jgi:serine/threonine protein kinase